MPVWSDDPIPPDALGCDGEPLDMEGLAKADPGFARLWRKVAARRSVILSLLYDRNPAASREEFEAECEADETLARHMAACEERYGRYLALCDSMEGGTCPQEGGLRRENRRALRPMALQGRLQVHVGAPPAADPDCGTPRIFRRDRKAELIM